MNCTNGGSQYDVRKNAIITDEGNGLIKMNALGATITTGVPSTITYNPGEIYYIPKCWVGQTHTPSTNSCSGTPSTAASSNTQNGTIAACDSLDYAGFSDWRAFNNKDLYLFVGGVLPSTISLSFGQLRFFPWQPGYDIAGYLYSSEKSGSEFYYRDVLYSNGGLRVRTGSESGMNLSNLYYRCIRTAP